MDAILATAHTLSADLLCRGCGQVKHEAWNPDSDGFYELHEEWCNGCAELHRDDERNKDSDPRRDRIVYVSERDDHPHGRLRPWTPGQNTPGSDPT